MKKKKATTLIESWANQFGYRKTYAFIALVLAQGAPIGHVVNHWFTHQCSDVGMSKIYYFITHYFEIDGGDLIYIWIGTSLAFGSFGYFVGIFADRLKEMSVTKDRLLAMVAHDLRNPIGNIHSYAELMEESISQDVGETDRTEIKNIAQRLRQQSDFTLILLNDLMDYSKIESVSMKLNLVEVDFEAYLHQKIEPLRMLAKAKNIDIIENFSDLNTKVLIDVNRIEQVLSNLISNAVKYSKEGTQVTLSVSSGQSGFVTLTISDQGQGIPQNELHKLFKPFSTTSVKGTKKEVSTGLGLYIVKRIVQLHGGDVECTSELGKGSRFSIHLLKKT